MRKNAQGKFSALGLAVLGLSLLGLIWDGRISKFVDPQLAILIFPAGLACVILAQVVLSASGNRRDRELVSSIEDEGNHFEWTDWPGWGVLWIIIPLIIGFLFP